MITMAVKYAKSPVRWLSVSFKDRLQAPRLQVFLSKPRTLDAHDECRVLLI